MGPPLVFGRSEAAKGFTIPAASTGCDRRSWACRLVSSIMTYIAKGPIDEDRWEPFEQVRATFGFLPNFFKAQTLRPDLIEAQLALIGGTMVKEGALTRRHKEYIFLVCSAANLSTYCVTAHC